MLIKILSSLALLLSFTYGAELDIENGEYCISSVQNGGTSKNSYYNMINLPDVYLVKRYKKNCKNNCTYYVISNSKGKTLKTFSSSDSLHTIAHNRYTNKAYLYYSYSYGSGKNRKTSFHLIDNSNKSYNIPRRASKSLTAITQDANFISVNNSGVYKNGTRIQGSKEFESIKITNNPNGAIAIAGVEKDTRTVYVSNTSTWINSGIKLAEHSDQKGILSVYPKDNKDVYVVAYNLINIYHKGLMGAHVNFATNFAESGWIYNYEKQNVGFDPEIYINDKHLVILATNSSTRQRVSFTITPKEYATIDENCPDREGFENEDMLSFMAGAGLEYLAWDASSSVSKNDIDYADTEYDISNSIYKKLYFQGRVGDTQLALSYMQNEAEKVGGLTKKASKALNFAVDFNSFISKSSTLRIAYSTADINGITTFIDENNGAVSVTPNGEQKEFESKIERISLLLMGERGLYAGLEYTKFTTPAAMGFSGSSKSVEYYGLDEELGLTNFELVAGYDTAAYAKRYETDFDTFYFQGLIGLGVSKYDISSEFKQKVENTSGKSIVSSDYSFVGDLELQVGYLWQQRFKAVKGLGYSIDLGLKARGSYTGIGQSEDSDSNIGASELSAEMTRYDIWYGPYAYFNIIF